MGAELGVFCWFILVVYGKFRCRVEWYKRRYMVFNIVSFSIFDFYGVIDFIVFLVRYLEIVFLMGREGFINFL